MLLYVILYYCNALPDNQSVELKLKLWRCYRFPVHGSGNDHGETRTRNLVRTAY